VDTSVIPQAIEVKRPLSSYIYDFYQTGDLQAIIAESRMPRTETEKNTDDFYKILKKIATSLEVHGPYDDVLVVAVKGIARKFPCYLCGERGHSGGNCRTKSLG